MKCITPFIIEHQGKTSIIEFYDKIHDIFLNFTTDENSDCILLDQVKHSYNISMSYFQSNDFDRRLNYNQYLGQYMTFEIKHKEKKMAKLDCFLSNKNDYMEIRVY